ncbi:acetaldehyde dehydrogenase (acetylating) [Priestia taiwanensis]|uniref:Acetaldehyde dehydrogenase n=1 Tax=Priestia taiwanensis TaxID=1347902 RepID=A0A917ANY5_9BACI|nr:acetaldehyde dehydrogenase (acetylating) [Priestia taiwanensis]MBM7362267.1 acetaldehyde dehydrogenase [Priestia taiwanensis]GGE60837.1 acetaldehyde dehydrogenase [Priestia taiwanensis]
MEKVKVAIIGSGNIGTDLMYKLKDNRFLELTMVIGIDSTSDGLKRAVEMGVRTCSDGLESLLDDMSFARIIFDASSAKAHKKHAELLKDTPIKLIDLTPAALGPFVVPSVNLHHHLDKENLNMVTCGGQATIPIVHAINEVADVSYAEIVATISSASAGPGTRANIDEFTMTTKRALEEVGGADCGKAIILLNPANPPILMRNTVYCEVKKVDEEKIIEAIKKIANTIQEYVPGYRLKLEPLLEESRVTVFIEVEGAGDYFPVYAGNLDIMTAAAVKVGEMYAKYLVSVSH